MNYPICTRCGKQMTERVSIPCPDGRPGCGVYHFKYVCLCEDVHVKMGGDKQMIPFHPLKDSPPEPWKERCYYVVNVSWRSGNPWHKALLYTGFLSGGKPSSYAGLFNPSYEPEFLKLNDSGLRITVVRCLGNILED